MSDLKLTPSLLSMLERIEKHSGTLLMLAVTASGGQDGKLNRLRGTGYVVKCDHPTRDKRVIFRRHGDRYIVFLGDDRIGFVRRADNGTWNHVEANMVR